MGRDRPFRLDSAEDYAYLLIGLLVGGALLYAAYPIAYAKWYDYKASKIAPYGGDAIYMPDSYMQRIAEDYRNSIFEKAYCFRLSDNGTVVELWTADIKQATERDIEFICPGMQGMIHTHPNGIPLPSQKDIEELKRAEGYISCVYARYMACWRADDGVVRRVKVEVN